MPSTRVLLVVLGMSFALAVLTAFTLVGLVFEGVAALAVLGLGLRAACSVAARVRGAEPC